MTFFTNNINPEEQHEINTIIETFKQGLNKEPVKTPKEYLTESYTKLLKVQYEPYESVVFENKMQTDLYFYEVIFKDNLNEELSENISESLKSLYETISDIYYHINIKPEFYKNLNEEFLLESIDDKERIIKEHFNNYINRNYFKLSPEERVKKYQPLCESNSTEFLKNSVERDKAIEYGFKTYLLEDLLTEVAFPKYVWNRIIALQEDEDYKSVFDYERLNTLVDTFKSRIHEISQVGSMYV
jgi:hypothetical protein